MESPSLLSRDQSESPSYRDFPRDGRFSTESSSRGCDSTMSNTSSRSGIGHATHRSSSGEGHRTLRTGSAEGRPTITRRSLTASDSSPEEEDAQISSSPSYQRTSIKNRKRFSSQSSFDNDDTYDNNPDSYRASQNSIIRRPSNVAGGGASGESGNQLLTTSGRGLRQTASEIFLDSRQSRMIGEVRRKSDSPSSDMSCDMMMRVGPNSPPNESMSSPDWTRTGSPRHSGDGEHVLHLRE